MYYGSYASLSDIRAALDYSTDNTDHDIRLRAVLEATSRQIDEYCRRHFYVRTQTKYYDGVLGIGRVIDQYTQELTEYYSKLWIDDLLAETTIKMDSDGDAVWEDVLASTDYILWPYNSWPKVRIDLDLRQGDYSYWVSGQQRIEIAASWGYGDGASATPYVTSGATVTVADATTTTLTTSDGSALEVAQTILAGTEQAYITAISGNNLTAVRGVNGTTAAAQASATAYIYRYPEQVKWATILRAEWLWKRRDAIFGVTGTTALGQIKMSLPPLDPDTKLLLQPFCKTQYRGAV